MNRFAMLAAASALALSAVAVPALAQNAATVNGKTISQKSVDQFVAALVSQGAGDTPELREQAKQELINREILTQAAEKAGLPKQEDVSAALTQARQAVLVRALMADHLKKNPITDASVEAEYNKVKAAQGDAQEYQVRHILVEDEKTAQDLTKQLTSKKADFAELAKQHSKDPGSAERGGELGWAPASNYVGQFADAVSKLKKGEMSKAPVQTQFGWHVIEVQDARPVSFPPLEQVRGQIEDMLRQQSLAAYQQSLREKATIK